MAKKKNRMIYVTDEDYALIAASAAVDGRGIGLHLVYIATQWSKDQPQDELAAALEKAKADYCAA